MLSLSVLVWWGGEIESSEVDSLFATSFLGTVSRFSVDLFSFSKLINDDFLGDKFLHRFFLPG